jgi:hypothetical protein
MENSMLGSMYSWLGKGTLQDIYTAKHLGNVDASQRLPLSLNAVSPMKAG